MLIILTISVFIVKSLSSIYVVCFQDDTANKIANKMCLVFTDCCHCISGIWYDISLLAHIKHILLAFFLVQLSKF